MDEFNWPHDTVFVAYGNMFTFTQIVMELHALGFYFVVDPNSHTIAMAESASVALGLDVEQ